VSDATPKSFMPICLDVSTGRIVVVGGGAVARHKLRWIGSYAQDILVIAPQIDPQVAAAASECRRREFAPEDLDGALLVYACTDEREVNLHVAAAARARGIPVNVCDDPRNSDFVSPAIYKQGSMSVAVSSNGTDVKRSLEWRARIEELLRHA